MAWGGARLGAGRKPKAGKPAVVLGMDGRRKRGRKAEASAVVASGDVQGPPESASAAIKRTWAVLAPLAQAQGTLTAQTAPGFAALCAMVVSHEKLERRVLESDPGAESWDKLHAQYIKHGRELRLALQGYRLAAFGKPEVAVESKAVDPFAEFEAHA